MTEESDQLNASRAPLNQHLRELKTRLIICIFAYVIVTCLCYLFAGNIYAFLVKPLADISGSEHRRLIYTGLAEAFITYIKLALFAGFIICFPLFAWQLYHFIAPGLYKREKVIFLPYLIAAPILFLTGAAMAYYMVFPMAWKFFSSFESGTGLSTSSLPIQLEARVSEYLSLSMHIIMAFGFCFQLPIVLTLLTHADFVTSQKLKSKRRIAIVVIFAVAAVITPPDILSQLLLAIPLMMLYEISILACQAIEKGKTSRQHA